MEDSEKQPMSGSVENNSSTEFSPTDEPVTESTSAGVGVPEIPDSPPAPEDGGDETAATAIGLGDPDGFVPENTTAREPTDGAEISTGNGTAENDQADEARSDKKKKRIMRILRNVFLVAVIALGIWALFGIVGEIGTGDGASFGEVLRGADPLFCVVLVLIVLCAMSLDVGKFCIVCKTVTGKALFRTSVKANFIGKYYDAVTPFAAGGQPMQIYYLNTKGISGGNSSAIVLIRYIFSIMCWIILGAAFMIVGTVNGYLDGVSGGNLLLIAGWVGIGFNMIIPMFVILFLVLPKLMTKLTVGIVKLGAKMKIVKDVDKTTARATKVVTDFKSAFKTMATSPAKFILLLITCFCESAITFSIPYFVMKAFSCPVDSMALSIISLNVFAIFGVSFIPTPGNSGVMEGMGALAFSAAAGATIIWSVLTWRFVIFYIYIIIGLVMTVYDIIKKNVRKKKDKTPSGADTPPNEL